MIAQEATTGQTFRPAPAADLAVAAPAPSTRSRISALTRASMQKEGHTVPSLLALLRECEELAGASCSVPPLSVRDVRRVTSAEERILKKLTETRAADRLEALHLLEAMQHRLAPVVRSHAIYGKHEWSAMLLAHLDLQGFIAAEARAYATEMAERVRRRGVCQVMPACSASAMMPEFIEVVSAMRRHREGLPGAEMDADGGWAVLKQRIVAMEHELSWKPAQSVAGAALSLAVAVGELGRLSDLSTDAALPLVNSLERLLFSALEGLQLGTGFRLHAELAREYARGDFAPCAILRAAIARSFTPEAGR